jgi:ParB-like chromosome segregation protein Spo0J
MTWKTDDVAWRMCQDIDQDAKIEDVPIEKIDKTASRHNGARQEPFHAELVREYAAAMRQGDVFPCIVVARVDSQAKLIVAGGNHRFAAAQSLGHDKVKAIVVRCNEAQFRLLAKQLNTTNGLRETTAARAEGAADLVTHANYSTADAARAMGVSKSTLLDVLTRRRLQELAEQHNYSLSLSAGSASEFAGMLADTDITVELLEYCACSPSNTHARIVARDVRAATSVANRKAVLRAAADELREQKRRPKKVRMNTHASITRSVKTLENNIGRSDTKCKLQMSEAEIVTTIGKLELIVQHLREVVRQADST